MSTPAHWIDNKTVTATAPASTAIAAGDLLYYDEGSDTVKPASSQTDATSLVLNQATFAANFVGVSSDQRIAAQSTVGEITVETDCVREYPCASATFEIGALVGAVENAGGDGLESQKVVEVTDPRLAIGVTAAAGTSVTKIRVRLIGRKASSHLAKLFTANDLSRTNTETLAGTKTLVVSDATNQVLDPGGSARTVTLPNEAASKGKLFHIANTADAAEVITLKSSDGNTTIATPTQNETAYVWCDGTTWRAIVGANN